MATLAIDTSGEYLALALAVGEKRYFSLDKVNNKQSIYIIFKINELCIQSGVKPTQLTLIAYTEGPGSFTGLRIGLSVALGLALGASAKLIAIPTFAIYAMALKSQFEGNIVVGLDARLQQVYLAGINNRTFEYFIDPLVIDPEKIELNQDCVLVGNGFNVYHDYLNKSITELKLFDIDYPTPTVMLDIIQLNKYLPIPLKMANLLYLRNKVALSLKEQIQKNAN